MTVAELGGHCCVLEGEDIVFSDAIPSEIDVGQRADGVGIVQQPESAACFR